MTHEPSRPSWRCARCGRDWPCRRRRAELLEQNDGSVVPIAMLMASYFEEAVGDHPTVLVSALYVRFFGWLRGHPREDRHGRTGTGRTGTGWQEGTVGKAGPRMGS